MVLESVYRIIREQFNITDKELSLDTSIRDDLNADSLDLVELVMALEDEFGLEVEDDNIDTLETLDDVVSYIKGILGEVD